MSINYHNRRFKVVSQATHGEVDGTTIFHYQQEGDVLTGQYSGGEIVTGHLIGIVDERGHIVMRYHHINRQKKLMTGQCQSTPEVLANGKIRLHERWTWTSASRASGESIIEEL